MSSDLGQGSGAKENIQIYPKNGTNNIIVYRWQRHIQSVFPPSKKLHENHNEHSAAHKLIPGHRKQCSNIIIHKIWVHILVMQIFLRKWTNKSIAEMHIGLERIGPLVQCHQNPNYKAIGLSGCFLLFCCSDTDLISINIILYLKISTNKQLLEFFSLKFIFVRYHFHVWSSWRNMYKLTYIIPFSIRLRLFILIRCVINLATIWSGSSSYSS